MGNKRRLGKKVRTLKKKMPPKRRLTNEDKNVQEMIEKKVTDGECVCGNKKLAYEKCCALVLADIKEAKTAE